MFREKFCQWAPAHGLGSEFWDGLRVGAAGGVGVDVVGIVAQRQRWEGKEKVIYFL